MPGQTMRRRTRRAPRRYKKRLTGYRKRKVYRTDPRGMIGFPKQRVVKMRYTQNITLDPTGPTDVYEFAANNINSPQYLVTTGTGRPLGYNQWSTFYKRWLVIGSRIRIMPVYASTTAGTIPLLYGVNLYNAGESPSSNPLLLIEQGKCKYRIMQPIQNGAYQPISYSFSPKKWYNMKNLKDNWNELYGIFSAGSGAAPPSKVAVYGVFAASADGSTNVQPINFTIQIDYLVLCQEPLLLPTSNFT